VFGILPLLQDLTTKDNMEKATLPLARKVYVYLIPPIIAKSNISYLITMSKSISKLAIILWTVHGQNSVDYMPNQQI
jgi:hypothetical protein